ncbi:MAG: peroxiredoxin [Candidatus Binataceae bacterium]
MPPEDPGTLSAAAIDLALEDQNGEPRRLADFRGRNLVLYFYPMDETPGCTVEGKEFRELFDQFKELECAVVGASTDSVESHRAFAEKHDFPFILLSDPKGELAQAFGVFKGKVAARSTFVLDRELRVRRAFHDVTPRGHGQMVLDFVRTILESHRMIGG